MDGPSGIVFMQTLFEIRGYADIALALLRQAFKKIDVKHAAALRR
jgi:hypothetical protein